MNRVKLVADYTAGISSIETLIKTLPEDSFDFIPTIIDDWSIRQHIIHLVDCEVNNFIRIKSCIAQPYSNVFVIYELNWTKNLGLSKENINDYLSLFYLIRKIMSSFLESVSDNDFFEKYFIYTYNNETKNVLLYEAVEKYCNHVHFHIDYIKKIYNEYIGQKS